MQATWFPLANTGLFFFVALCAAGGEFHRRQPVQAGPALHQLQICHSAQSQPLWCEPLLLQLWALWPLQCHPWFCQSFGGQSPLCQHGRSLNAWLQLWGSCGKSGQHGGCSNEECWPWRQSHGRGQPEGGNLEKCQLAKLRFERCCVGRGWFRKLWPFWLWSSRSKLARRKLERGNIRADVESPAHGSGCPIVKDLNCLRAEKLWRKQGESLWWMSSPKICKKFHLALMMNLNLLVWHFFIF